ncbi:ABC transporter ATP-binding protein [Nocardioides hwasunensis]|uniref:ABC transporter ATP-binding protein n=1 Tax=Nocardioides hwasunensis TaxID=397258 RepID=A0ABR8MNS1_9ACTN|nr:ABC transporter ATP-binding protein [Nocardioides hwasunensis]
MRGVSKSYGTEVAVAPLDLTVEAGSFVSFLGPSGSGKTTTLKMISGFERPDEGAVLFGDRDITSQPPEQRGVGVVFQNYSLFPHMSVAKNVEFPLRMRGVDRSDRSRRVRAALELVELPHVASRSPHELSGGQQQRVAIARALVFDPALLLMDEPLGALDRRLRETMQLEIKALHERLDVTIIYVTHDQEEALAMSDQIVVFNQGRVEQVGTPQDVYDRPRSLFVADFLGESFSISGQVTGGAFTADGDVPLRLDVADVEEGPARSIWRSGSVSAAPRPGERDSWACVPTTVVASAFAGDHLKLKLRVASGDEGIVSVPPTSSVPIAGDALDIYVDHARAVVVSASGGTA